MTSTLDDYDDILDAYAVAYILGLSRATTLKLLRNGTIPGIKCGRKWRILKSDLLLFLKANPRQS